MFSSLALTASINGTPAASSTVNAPDILNTTVFTFDPPISIAGGSDSITFALSGVISGGQTARLDFDHGRIRLAGIVATRSPGAANYASLFLGLTIFGFVIAPLRVRQRRRIAIATLAILAMAAALAGCGGSSGGPGPVAAMSTQEIVAISVVQDANEVPVGGLPADLGTVTKQ